MKFIDIDFSRENRFSIGVEEETGKFFVSIPVRNQRVDYEEYYEISREMFESFKVDMDSALPFVQKCRDRELDYLLLQNPGSDRGISM
ncbi:MAG: hypothetical protein KBT82_06615 [Marinobacter sp.]|uniref:hypothetical protein n=1 Tax=Marinobacter sp. TaxID=50741 RepID=UPI001B7A74D6|nr:hypothetical protein [Marinobacter sp.]MBQ0746318.1 hypothetical protein [Marinobacter sp.]MBQ0813838.1 hypothetical protein [Marinobacter sp.]|tara:strand:+ start:226 stop:489 length:264 start_codon:yes stop_codon:yes gene_type:complete